MCVRCMESYRLCPLNRPSSGLRTHSRERAEGIVCQNIDSLDTSISNTPRPRTREHRVICSGEATPTYPVVRLQIVDLLAEDEHPEVLTEELDHVEGVVEARAVPREAATRGQIGGMSAHVPTFPADDIGTRVAVKGRKGGVDDNASCCYHRHHHITSHKNVPLDEPLSHPVAQGLEPVEDGVPLLLLVHGGARGGSRRRHRRGRHVLVCC